MVAGFDDNALVHLMKLRLVVARIGEMDNAKWWNTKGLLGRLGSMALKRGFPKSHDFAQARAVFSTASMRCRQLFDPPGCMTLWHLPADVEEQFETQWATWMEQHEQWADFFEVLQSVQGTDVLAAMVDLDVITKADVAEAKKLKRASDNRAVPLSGVHQPCRDSVTLLATGFFRGEPGQPAVPYARLEDA